MGRLASKVAVVTGGSAGIGEAIAKLFADEGAAVVITGRRREALNRVSRNIESRGGTSAGSSDRVAGAAPGDSAR